MSTKTVVMIGLTVGTMAGSYIPILWGGSLFSYTSIILGAIGGILGITIAYQLGKDLG